MASPTETLEGRWQKLAYLGEFAWIFTIVVGLLFGYVDQIDPLHNEYLSNIVDVPEPLAVRLRTDGIQIDWLPLVSFPHTYAPEGSFAIFRWFLSITGFVAALRGRWLLMVVCMAGFLVPGAPFGAIDPQRIIFVFVGLAAIGRCAFKREFKLAISLGAIIFVAWLGTGFTNPHLRAPTLSVHRDPDAAEVQRMTQLELALAQTPANDRASVAYVRAQIAFIRQDWTQLKAIGPINGAEFPDSPTKSARLRVIRAARLALEPHPEFDMVLAAYAEPIRWFYDLCLLTVAAISVLGGFMRYRIKRIAKLQDQISRLTMRKTVAP